MYAYQGHLRNIATPWLEPLADHALVPAPPPRQPTSPHQVYPQPQSNVSAIQEVEHEAAVKKGPTVWRMQPLFFARAQLQGSHAMEAARTMAELLSVGAVTGLKPGVAPLVQKLDAVCGGNDPPPVAIIRHPRVSYCKTISAVDNPVHQGCLAWAET